MPIVREHRTFGIGQAVKEMKDGERVSRSGWNGKDMWLSYTPGNEVPWMNLWSKQNKDFAYKQPNRCVEVLPYITMKTADNKIVPWLCSQTDLLAEDWFVVENPPEIADAAG